MVLLSTAVSTCATLHDAARVDAGIFSADVRTDTVRYNAANTVSGDAALYTTGVCAVFPLLIVHVLPFTMLVGSMLPLFSAVVRADTALQCGCYS